MTRHCLWCPSKKGCGKGVLRDWNLPRDSPKPYFCDRCNKHFSQEEIDEIN